MALIFADRVRETTTTTGTGAFSLGGAVTGYRTFSSVMVNTDTTYYACAGQGTSEWEVGIGTWNTGNTLSRTTILASSNGGSAVTFSAGTKDIFITYAAGKTVIQDASGNVGIGTSSPGSKLTVSGDIQILSTNYLSFSNTAQQTYIRASATNTLAFGTNSTQALTLDASGNLGINSTSPSTFGKVTVQVAGTTTPTNLTNVGPSSINLYAASNGGSTDSTMGIFGWNATTGIGSGIGFVRESSSDWGTQIRFYTHPTSTTNIGDITERARIDSSGNLLLGTTTSPSGSSKVVFRQSGTSSPDATWNGSVWGLAAVGGEPALYLSSNIVAATGVAGATQTAKGGIGFRYVSAANPTELDIGIIGSPTVASPVCFYNNTERARITSGGNLGIGTTSPQKPLHVYSSTAAVGNATMIVEGATGGYGAGVSFQSVLTGGSLAEMARITADGEAAWNTTASTQDAGLRFYTALDGTVAEKIRLDASGNLGIGTTSISERLVVNGNASVDVYKLRSNTATPASTDSFIYRPADNTLAFGTASTERARIDSSGNLGVGRTSIVGSSGSQTVEASGCLVAGGPLASHQTSRGVFEFNSDKTSIRSYGSTAGTGFIAFNTGGGGGSADTERARISSTGNFGIALTNPGAKLDVYGSGNLVRFGDGTNTFDVRFQGPNNWDLQLNTSTDVFSLRRNSTALFYSDASGNAYATSSFRAPIFYDSDNTAYYANPAGSSEFSTFRTLTAYITGQLGSGGVMSIGTSNSPASDVQLLVSNAGTTGLEISATSIANATLLRSYSRFTNAYQVAYYQAYGHFFYNDNNSVYGSFLYYNGAGGAYGYRAVFNNVAPNNTTYMFYSAADSAATRYIVYSNGGIANYQANNVNLSDAREKRDIQLASSYLDKICAIPVKTFLYNDQPDDVRTLGVIAQDVLEIAPELVAETNWNGLNEPEKLRYSIYQTDLQYALMKCIQELNAKVAALESKLANQGA